MDAARAEFARRGYEGASIRAIARLAGVDPSLVHHYFDRKDRLFVAAMELPVNPADLVPKVLEGGEAELGERLVRAFLQVWDGQESRARLIGMLRSAFTNERAATMLKEFLTRTIFEQAARRLDLPQARLRANLIGSHLVGLAILRYVIRVEPLASANPEAVVSAVGPTIQRYLTAGGVLADGKPRSKPRSTAAGRAGTAAKEP